MRRIIAGMLVGLMLGCAAWAVGDQGATAGTDKARRVFTARRQAMRLADLSTGHGQPTDACGACLGISLDMGESYTACENRCREACGLGRASAWAQAE